MMGRRRVGLFGGTFDPPHLGHLIVAEAARETLELDALVVVVAGDPWMKRTTASPDDRVRMCELATDDCEGFEVSRVEVDRAGPTYTADTLASWTSTHQDDEVYFLLGQDAAARMSDWHEPDRARSLATFVTFGRPGHGQTGDVRWIDVPQVDISSTEIRRRLASGRSIRFLVPRAVEEHARAHRLYDGGRRPR